MTIPFTDLRAQYLTIKDEIDRAIQQVINDSRFILGSEVKLLEEEIAKHCNVKYGIGVASGTDALILSLIACGIKPGDEVITTPFTFVATGEAIVQIGAKPIFVDIEEKTYNIDPDKIKEKITEKTKGIVPVHLFGQCCNMEKIMEISKKHNLMVIEDSAQAIGAEFKGRKAGSIGDAGCLSFFPAKTLGCYGDGGMVVTNSSEISEKVRILRNHGSKKKNYQEIQGFNSRLDTIQAAILRVKLKYLDKWIDSRWKNAELYTRLLREIDEIIPPYIAPYARHSFNYFSIRIKNGKGTRDELKKYLIENGVNCSVYYPLSLHLQQIYKDMGYKSGDFPISESIQEETLALPMYPELEKGQIEFVVDRIKDFFKGRK